MAVFTLDELRELPSQNIFLAEVDYQKANDNLEYQEELSKLLKEEEKYLGLWPHRKEEIEAYYRVRRKELLLYGNVVATIIYMDDEKTVDLLSNEKLSDEDLVIQETLCPISFYLGEKPLEYGVVFQSFPLECFARVNDERFSYFDFKSQNCHDGALLDDYAFWKTQIKRSKLYQDFQEIHMLIAMCEDAHELGTMQVIRKLNFQTPYFSQYELDHLDLDRMYCAMITYENGEDVLPNGKMYEMDEAIEEAYQVAKEKYEYNKERFFSYKKRREADVRKTNRGEFDRRRKWYLKSEEELVDRKAERNNYLKCCQMASTILYETEDGYIDLYANQKLEATKAEVVEATKVPFKTFCEDDVHFEVKRALGEDGYYMVLVEPVVAIATSTSSSHDHLLNAYASLYYQEQFLHEKEKILMKTLC